MEPQRNRGLREYSQEISRTRLRQVFASLDCAAILDIGCGLGLSWRYFPAPFWYYGLEPSPLPQRFQPREPQPDHVILVHNDPNKPLPVVAEGFTMATFLAAYDHIPNRQEVLRQAWASLRVGGHLVFYMTNYGFWAKRLVNTVARRSAFRHERDHYCVHSPETLTLEVSVECPGARLAVCQADYFWIPNSRTLFLYRNRALLRLWNSLGRAVIHGVLGLRNAGASMICVFEKTA